MALAIKSDIYYAAVNAMLDKRFSGNGAVRSIPIPKGAVIPPEPVKVARSTSAISLGKFPGSFKTKSVAPLCKDGKPHDWHRYGTDRYARPRRRCYGCKRSAREEVLIACGQVTA